MDKILRFELPRLNKVGTNYNYIDKNCGLWLIYKAGSLWLRKYLGKVHSDYSLVGQPVEKTPYCLNDVIQKIENDKWQRTSPK